MPLTTLLRILIMQTATTSSPLRPVPTGDAENGNSNWKSDRIINVYLSDDNGGRMKVGNLSFRMSDINHANLIKQLDQDIEATTDPANPVQEVLQKFVGKLVFDYQTTEKKERSFTL